MKEKILVISKSDLGPKLQRGMTTVVIETAGSLELVRTLLNRNGRNYSAIVADLRTEEGWRIVEYLKNRLSVEELRIPLFAVVPAGPSVSTADCPFHPPQNLRNVSLSDLALEYGVTAVVTQTDDEQSLILLLETHCMFSAEKADAVVEEMAVRERECLETGWQSINRELQRLHGELVRWPTQEKLGLKAPEENRRLETIAGWLQKIKLIEENNSGEELRK